MPFKTTMSDLDLSSIKFISPAYNIFTHEMWVSQEWHISQFFSYSEPLLLFYTVETNKQTQDKKLGI